MKICKTCLMEKEYSFYYYRIRFDTKYYDTSCKHCVAILRDQYNKNYTYNNYEKIRLAIKSRRKKISEKQRQKRAENASLRLRDSVSSLIYLALKRNLSSKNKKSCCKYLPYSIKELKTYIESKFEPWMNWENKGKYNSKNWNDNDNTTWTWEIDHIIPQSDLPYISMEDDNFKKCWALSNLRPYSAKQNCIDGSTRIRHSNDCNK